MTNTAGGEVQYQTPAEDLDLRVRYSHTYQRYDSTLSALSFYNNKVVVTSRVNVSSHFRFLPKSVASGSVEYGQTNFNDSATGGVTNNDSKGISTMVGMTSQFTRKLSGSASAGVSILLFEAGPDQTAATAESNVRYSPNASFNVLAGYRRSFQVSTFTNYYELNEFRLEAFYKFARRFELNVKNTYSFLDFSGPNTNLDGSDRNDFLIRGSAGLSYAFIDWGRLKLEYETDYRNSNAVDTFGGASSDFIKHRVNVGVELYY